MLLGGKQNFLGLFITAIRSDRCSVTTSIQLLPWPRCSLWASELSQTLFPWWIAGLPHTLVMVARCDDTTSWMWLCYGVFIPCVCVCVLSSVCVFIPCVGVHLLCVCSSLLCVHALCVHFLCVCVFHPLCVFISCVGIYLLCVVHLLVCIHSLCVHPLCVCVHLLCVCSPPICVFISYVCVIPFVYSSPVCVLRTSELPQIQANFSLSTWYLPIFS